MDRKEVYRRVLGTDQVEIVPTRFLDALEVVAEIAAGLDERSDELEAALWDLQLVSKRPGWPCSVAA